MTATKSKTRELTEADHAEMRAPATPMPRVKGRIKPTTKRTRKSEAKTAAGRKRWAKLQERKALLKGVVPGRVSSETLHAALLGADKGKPVPGWKRGMKTSEYDVVGGIDARSTPAKVMEVRYEKPEQPVTGYHPRPGARPTIYVPREMTEEEHKKHLAVETTKTTLEIDPKHAANIAKIRLYEAEQAKVKAAQAIAPTSAAFKWSHAQVLCEKPLRKIIVEKRDNGLHVVAINTTATTQHHTHFKISMEAAQSLHDLFELVGCTPTKTPMAIEMTFEVPQEPTRGVDA